MMLKQIEITISNSAKMSFGEESPFICLKQVFELEDITTERMDIIVNNNIEYMKNIVNAYVGNEVRRIKHLPPKVDPNIEPPKIETKIITNGTGNEPNSLPDLPY